MTELTEAVSKPDVIVAFGFSKKGMSNFRIAHHAQDLSDKYNVPIFTQSDVSDELYIDSSKPLAYDAEETDGYLSTLGIVRSLKRKASDKKWKRVMVVAAPCHEWRCVRDLRKTGFEILEDESDYKRKYRRFHWFHEKDPQVWVRNPVIWWLREIPLRVLPWSLYSRLT